MCRVSVRTQTQIAAFCSSFLSDPRQIRGETSLKPSMRQTSLFVKTENDIIATLVEEEVERAVYEDDEDRMRLGFSI